MSYYNNSNNNSNNHDQGSAGGTGSNSNYYGAGGGSSHQQQPPTYQQQQQQPVNTSNNNVFHQGYGDPNAWQQQQYDQQHQQQQQQQQQQPQPQQHYQPQQAYPMQPQQAPQSNVMNSFWDPAMAAKMATMAVASTSSSNGGGMNEAMMLNIAGEASKSFLQSKSAQLLPGYMEQMMNLLRTYFAVDNKYVVLKMKRIVLPFLCKHWKRQQKDAAPSISDHSIPMISYQLPIYDECAPDLYIPIMSGITYVLIAAFLTGTVGKFNPQVIPSITTYCLIIQVLEVLCIRLGFYLMQCHVAMLDLFSYTGYKYFGLCINLLFAMMIGRHGLNLFSISGVGGVRTYYLSFVWTASALSYFMLKTMANNIPLHTAPNGPKREIMVLAFAASQFITMWLVSRTKYL